LIIPLIFTIIGFKIYTTAKTDDVQKSICIGNYGEHNNLIVIINSTVSGTDADPKGGGVNGVRAPLKKSYIYNILYYYLL